jgi:hypothetical protein
MAMMAMTTSSSSKVNPREVIFQMGDFMQLKANSFHKSGLELAMSSPKSDVSGST